MGSGGWAADADYLVGTKHRIYLQGRKLSGLWTVLMNRIDKVILTIIK
jgi:hypothetical protein